MDTWTGGAGDRLPTVRLMDDPPELPNENIQIPVTVWMQTVGERHSAPDKAATHNWQNNTDPNCHF